MPAVQFRIRPPLIEPFGRLRAGRAGLNSAVNKFAACAVRMFFLLNDKKPNKTGRLLISKVID